MVKDNGKFKGCFVQKWEDSVGICYYLEVGSTLFLLSCFGKAGDLWFTRCPWENVNQCITEMGGNRAEELTKACNMKFIKRFQV